MEKIVIAVKTQEIAEHWQKIFQTLAPNREVVVWNKNEAPMGARYAVVWQPPLALFEKEKKLQAIFNLGAGVDALGINSVVPAHVPVYRIEDAGMAVQMAEYAIYGVLLATERFSTYSKLQKQLDWAPQPPVLRSQWPIGVMGYGQIGSKVAKALAQLGYPISVWVRSERVNDEHIQFYSGRAGFDHFLKQTRVLINVLPLTEETRGIVNKECLEKMQKDGFFINMARGAHVVDDDLLSALRGGQLKGALLDVFHEEPLPKTHPFWQEPNVYLTPHIAGISLYEECAKQVIEKLFLLERGIEPTGRVSLTKQY